PLQALLSKQDLDKLRELPGGGATAAGARDKASALRPASAATVLPNISPDEAADALRAPLDLRTAPLVWAPAVFLGDQPGKIGPGEDEVNAGDTVVDGLLSLMRGAQREVVIVSPYLVPG